jgi:riboflavin kinase/FMN adenylyltransferase
MHENIFGKVVHGLGKGAQFGFPTINIELIDKELHIESGVYAVNIVVHNQSYNGMLYVGTRPTFNLHERSIEIHIFEFNDNIYHRQISFKILHKIRDEIKFDSTEKLIEQLHQDHKTVYNFFTNP